MTQVIAHEPGTFCWVDLGTSDEEGAKEFYTSLFGWTSVDITIGFGDTYTVFRKEGADVAAMYGLDPAIMAKGIPPSWLSYVAVEDVDAAAVSAKELGGSVLHVPSDVQGLGRIAVVRDPEGAVFGLWQAGEHAGAERINEPGALCWNELFSRDPDAAQGFYTTLFGWSARLIPGAASQPYTEFQMREAPKGGMLEIQKELGEVPPTWTVYFAVDDLLQTVERAEELGGQLEVEPMEVEGVGTFAFLQDPQGAFFAVIQLRPARA